MHPVASEEKVTTGPLEPSRGGRVDFQLVRNFLGGFTQMRRLLCDPAGWRDMMKAYLEKLDATVNSGNIRLEKQHLFGLHLELPQITWLAIPPHQF